MDVENFARLEQDPVIRQDAYLDRRLKYILVRERFLYYLVDPLVEAQGESIAEDSPGRSGLAWAHFYQGLWAQRKRDYAKAVASYQTSIRIDPALAVACHHLAVIQATCPMPQYRDGSSALEHAKKACDLTAWQNVASVETYAAAHARVGDFDAAVRWQQEALDRFVFGSDAGTKAQARARLGLYQRKGTDEQQYLWPNQLVAWWAFDRGDDRGESRQVRDHSGNGLHGRLRGDACIVQDPDRGEVLSLDGKGDFVDCGQDCRFSLTDAFSICAWIKPRVFDKKHQALVSNGDRGWMLNRQAYSNGMQVATYDYAADRWDHIPTKNEMTDGRWHHLVAVYDGAHLGLYVAGRLDNACSVTGRLTKNDWPVFIGENSELTGREWDGLIDDVRIYSKRLTPEEIIALYAE